MVSRLVFKLVQFLLLVLIIFIAVLIKFSFSSLQQHTDPDRDAELVEILSNFQAHSSVPVRERVLADLCDSGKSVVMYVCV